ncbi:MAG: heavy metal-responsive transcriptional regulator [Blastocatellia bacterium]
MGQETTKREYLRSGELARLAGVSTDTLRYYERKGLLARPRRSTNSYREYPESALDRVRLVRRSLAVGFTLDELARILEVRGRGGAPCREVRSLAGAKLAEVEAQIEELTGLRNELKKLLKNWDALLSKTAPSERARLLESLELGASNPRTRRSLARRPTNRRKETKESQW